MKLNTIIGQVIDINYKPGDRNPSVQVAYITMDNGLTFTATPHLDKQMPSEHFPTPYASLNKVRLGTPGVLFFGNRNGYAHPTFVGFVPTV